MTTYDLDELRALSLARQFPRIDARSPDAVSAAVAAIGPIQSQTARSPFVGLAARLPGISHAAVTEAYESWQILRGSTIRGTVHTSTADDHLLLDATTRVAQRAAWRRFLRLDHTELESVWRSIEQDAAADWRTPAELVERLTSWLDQEGETAAVAAMGGAAGRYFAFGHGGLVRRPLLGSWSGQGAPGYRTAAALLPRRRVPTDPLTELVARHVTAYGPSSRQDIAWWSGLGLRQVDALLERLEVTWRDGPDGRRYADLPTPAGAARELPGVRLLPEFDALLCGYDPKARDRFVSPADNAVLWHRSNGLMLAPVLVDGRIGGHWRLAGQGSGRTLSLVAFPRSRRPRRAEAEQAAHALATALDITITEVTIGRA